MHARQVTASSSMVRSSEGASRWSRDVKVNPDPAVRSRNVDVTQTSPLSARDATSCVSGHAGARDTRAPAGHLGGVQPRPRGAGRRPCARSTTSSAQRTARAGPSKVASRFVCSATAGTPW